MSEDATATTGAAEHLGEHAAVFAGLREQIVRDRATAEALRDYLRTRAAEQPAGAAVVVDAPSPTCVAEARAYARRRCDEHQVHGERCDALELAVSELVGNALRHGSPPISYQITADGDDLLLTVSDSDPAPPVASGFCGHDAESGRGLFLLGAMARGWGWHRAGHGKAVWARV